MVSSLIENRIWRLYSKIRLERIEEVLSELIAIYEGLGEAYVIVEGEEIQTNRQEQILQTETLLNKNLSKEKSSIEQVKHYYFIYFVFCFLVLIFFSFFLSLIKIF